jgi:2,4-dienoyl-CoA reductase-like NADH-dependent reductase (Old Yellow Enzyme family)/thioredoxin reductase
MDNARYERILSPGSIGSLRLKNRIIFNPCETLYATIDGEVTQKLIDFYVRRAEGGAALLVVHSAQACTRLDPIDPFPHSLRVDDNAYIPMLGELTEAVHRAGARIAILVSPGGGAQSMGFPYDRGLEGVVDPQNVGASEEQSFVAQRRVRKLAVDEIRKIVEVYGLSARRVMLAGFDAFYIHALGGYLISQFISPRFNTRTDEYGGDEERRMRFLLEIVDACRRNAGPSFPLVVRMSIDEFFPGGRGVEESIRIIKKLEEAGVSAIDAGAGLYESMHMIIPPVYLPKGCLTDLAAAVKREVKIPVITQGRLYEPEMAESLLKEGKADFVAMTRGMLAEPCWVNKVAAGRAAEIRKCITCNQCIDRVLKGLTVRCAINPTAGREGEFSEIPPKAAKAKKVVVVGGGPGGMEAARVAGERGHSVTLFEKGSELGAGQMKRAAAAPCKDEFLNLVRYYEGQFKRLKNVKVVLNKEAGPDDVAKEKPDAVVLATGAVSLVPSIPGVDGKNVVTAHDLSAGKAKASGKVVIAGGGCAGSGIADMLSEKGLDVTVVEMLNDCAADEELITRLTLMARLAGKNVKLLTGHTVREIKDDGVVVADKEGAMKTLPADTVVLAFGALSHNPLEEQVRASAKSVQVVGDAGRVGKIKDAVVEGFLAAQRI